MLTNEMLLLSSEQLADYNAWAADISAAFFEEDCIESLEISLVFSFSVLGRSVEARVGHSTMHTLVLESAI
jgi:hypothetical protein